MVKKQKKIDVNTFKDPFTVYASGFAIPIQVETDDIDDVKQNTVKRRRLFRKLKK